MGVSGDRVVLCSIWARVVCALRQDYREAIDRIFSGGDLAESMDVIKPGLLECIEREIEECNAVGGSDRERWLDFYSRALALFNALAILLDPPKFGFLMETIFDVSDVSVAELKGLLDALCRSRES